MTTVAAAFTRDANHVPIVNLGLVATPKAITYAAATTGAVGITTLFTVTGVVAARVFAVVSGVDLTGSGTIEVGISGNTAALIAQVSATALDVGEIWNSNTPATVVALQDFSILAAGTDIIQTIASNTVTAGTLTFYCIWTPISEDGLVEAA